MCWLKINPFYRPGQALRFQDVGVSRFHNSRHKKVVRLSILRTGRLDHQEIFLVLISVRGWVNPRAIVWSKGLCHWKIPVTPTGIEPVTFRHIVQYLNRLCHRVPICCLSVVNIDKHETKEVKSTQTSQQWQRILLLELSLSSLYLTDFKLSQRFISNFYPIFGYWQDVMDYALAFSRRMLPTSSRSQRAR